MTAPATARARALAGACALALALAAAPSGAAAAIPAGSAAAAADPASGFEARCKAAAGGAGARFTTQGNGWRIDNSLSYRTLTRMKRPHVVRGLVLGLTHTESHVTVQVDGELLQDPQAGLECVLPRVAVTLTYEPIVVYIGREFAPGTCAYSELLAHEMRHLKSYLEALPNVEETVRARLAPRVQGRAVVARAGRGRAMLQREIDGAWLPVIRAEMQGIERRQAAIDSPQEYARLSKVCQGEVQSLIGSTRRPRS
ncbi:hypothetical protein [Massilia sp. 9096]|uniref:hypothetical protein n=1 Tax=Massilia sp. 9096 TaxID=1500894 RepID=UPI000AEC9396|nr:hypothetical protein [Massilia sp. 9096]